VERSSATAGGTLASLAILASTLLWGTLWIPLRQLNAAGTGDAWTVAASFFLPLLLLAPAAIRQIPRLCSGGLPLLLVGVFMAISVALYAEGMLRGQVARVILLFYLTPVWSTLLGRLMLGEPITPLRVLTIVLGLAGVMVLFGIEQGFPLPRSLADVMGLLSGICWGLAMVYMQKTNRLPTFDRVLLPFLFVGLIFLGLALIPGGRSLALPPMDTLSAQGLWLIAFALIWLLPVMLLTVYGGSRLDPGRVAILLMLEVVIGLGSAAWLAGEPFGKREILGAALILSAGGTEAFFQKSVVRKAS